MYNSQQYPSNVSLNDNKGYILAKKLDTSFILILIYHASLEKGLKGNVVNRAL